MSASPTSLRSPPQSDTPVFFAWLGAAAAGFGTGFAAVYLQDTFAPVGVFPLLIGLIAGLAAGGVWRARGSATKRSILLSGLLAGLVCTATLHYGSFYEARKNEVKRRAAAPATALLVDPDYQSKTAPWLTSFAAYMSPETAQGRRLGSIWVRGGWLALWSTLDAALILGAAMFGARAAAKSIIRPTTPDATLKSADAGAAS